jgi:serine/threonine protein kinase
LLRDPRARRAYEFFLTRYRRGARAFTLAQLSAATGYAELRLLELQRTQWFWFVRERPAVGRWVVDDAILSVPLLSFVRMCAPGPAPYPASPDDPDFPSAILPPRLELESETPIGMGVFGTVYRCRDRTTGAASAVKVVNPDVYWKGLGTDRLLAEVQVARRLGAHPGLVYRLDHGRLKEPFFVEMEWVEGRSLEERLHASGPLPACSVVRIAAQLTDVLLHAHERGVMHRDLKPGNVLLTDAGRVVVIDFGLALLDEPGGPLTAQGRRSGTWAYAAPEAVRGSPRAASDVYGMGVVLYEAVTGRVPRLGLLRKRTEVAPDPRAEAPDVDPGLAAFISRLLAYEAGDRPDLAACRETLNDLRLRLGSAA